MIFQPIQSLALIFEISILFGLALDNWQPLYFGLSASAEPHKIIIFGSSSSANLGSSALIEADGSSTANRILGTLIGEIMMAGSRTPGSPAYDSWLWKAARRFSEYLLWIKKIFQPFLTSVFETLIHFDSPASAYLLWITANLLRLACIGLFSLTNLDQLTHFD